MAYEHKEGQGTAFYNKEKKTSKHPDIDGSFMLNGVLYNLALWTKRGEDGQVKRSKDGKSMFSIKVSPPKKQENAAKPVANRDHDPFEDGLA